MTHGAESPVLVAGEAGLALAPRAGGSIAGLTWRGQDLFRPANAAALATDDPLGMASFPLVPFAGRVTGGRFRLDDRLVSLPPNLAGEGDAIHGQGWRRPWRLADRTATTARLVLDHAAGDWPWDYRAEQTFALAPDRLVQTLSVTNRSTRPMPAGLGLHPYFPRDADTALSASVTGVHQFRDGPASVLPEAWDWRGGRPFTAFVDHQFAGWSGSARLAWPARRLALTIACDPPTPWLVVYAPNGEPYVCVEPVSHRLDAPNRSPGGTGHGMALLPPGASIALTATFAWEAMGPGFDESIAN